MRETCRPRVLLPALVMVACGADPAISAKPDGARTEPPAPDARAADDGAGDAALAETSDGAAPSETSADSPSAPVDAETGTSTPPGWWDARWTKRSKITISDPDLKEDLADFQIPLKLDAMTFDYAASKSAGEDVRIVGDDGTVLFHEIDAWNPAGASLLWIRLPKIGPAPTIAWLYYGNKDAAAPFDAEVKAVWPAPYAGVWHLSGGARDSTASGFDGAQMVGGSYVDAQFGKGLQLDGSKHDHIDLKNDIKVLGGAAGCTFSAWIHPTKIEDSINGMIIMTLGKWFNTNHNSYADFNVNASGQMISHVDPGTNTAASGYARILSDPGFIKPNEWAWVTYVIDLAANQERFFKSGQLVSTKPPPAGKFDAPAFIDMVSTRVVIGSEEDNVSHWYTGSMDELRIEKGMRAPSFIAAQYRAMTVPTFVKVEPGK